MCLIGLVVGLMLIGIAIGLILDKIFRSIKD